MPISLKPERENQKVQKNQSLLSNNAVEKAPLSFTYIDKEWTLPIHRQGRYYESNYAYT